MFLHNRQPAPWLTHNKRWRYYRSLISIILHHPLREIRIEIRHRLLSQELGREANFGDLFADSLGYKVEDSEFQDIMRISAEYLGEEWP